MHVLSIKHALTSEVFILVLKNESNICSFHSLRLEEIETPTVINSLNMMLEARGFSYI